MADIPVGARVSVRTSRQADWSQTASVVPPVGNPSMRSYNISDDHGQVRRRSRQDIRLASDSQLVHSASSVGTPPDCIGNNKPDQSFTGDPEISVEHHQPDTSQVTEPTSSVLERPNTPVKSHVEPRRSTRIMKATSRLIEEV